MLTTHHSQKSSIAILKPVTKISPSIRKAAQKRQPFLVNQNQVLIAPYLLPIAHCTIAYSQISVVRYNFFLLPVPS